MVTCLPAADNVNVCEVIWRPSPFSHLLTGVTHVSAAKRSSLRRQVGTLGSCNFLLSPSYKWCRFASQHCDTVNCVVCSVLGRAGTYMIFYTILAIWTPKFMWIFKNPVYTSQEALRIRYKDQSVNGVKKNNSCLLYKLCATLCGQSAERLNIKSGFLLLPTWYTNFLFIDTNYIRFNSCTCFERIPPVIRRSTTQIVHTQPMHMYNLRRWPPDDGRNAHETCRGI